MADDAGSWVATPQTLETWLRSLGGIARIALDTEFLREKTYFPKLCLVQLAWTEGEVCLDPLALDLAPLRPLLAGEAVKVGHALRQDLEILALAGVAIDGPVFDTQIAAALLGHDDQIGYAALVEAELGVTLDKSHTRADWSVRPLTDAQRQYARDDVAYLLTLQDRLGERLADKGRIAWVLEDGGRLAALARREDQTPAWPRASAKLTPEAGHALGRLLLWREEEARRRDLPRQWLARDEVLLAVAQSEDRRPAALRALPDLPRALMRYTETWAARLAQEGSPLAVPEPPSREQEAWVRATLVRVREAAAELGIAPGVLASRRELLAYAQGGDPARFDGWRAALLATVVGPRPSA